MTIWARGVVASNAAITGPDGGRRRPWLHAWVLTTVLAAFSLAAWDLSNPGLQYDEMLFANAATGGWSDSFIHLRVAGVPILLMDYIGALKAWLYRPIFACLPANEWTLRIPAILMGLAGGILLLAALGRMLGTRAAAFGAPLILLDPSLLTHSRLDWGPNALMFFFRGLLLFAAASWVTDGRRRWGWLALFALAGGLFDKLNFLWCGYGVLGAVVLVYSERLVGFARLHKRTATVQATLFVVVAGLATLRAVGLSADLPHSASLSFRLAEVERLVAFVLVGGGALDFVAGRGMRLTPWVLPGFVACLLASAMGARQLLARRHGRAWAFLGVNAVLTALAMAATPGATGAHHAAVVAGQAQVLLAAPLAAVFADGERTWKRVFAVLAATTLASGLLVADLVCLSAFAAPTNPHWDRANIRAAEFARTRPSAVFLMADWGIGNQVTALSAGRVRVDDCWPAFSRLESARWVLEHLDPQRESYVMSYLPGLGLNGSRETLLAALDAEGIASERVAVFVAHDGRPMIEVLRLRPQAAAAVTRN